ncbi:MAG: VanW family protein [Actinomycetota bacterium]|nr:VanW family protein [Actinomycetota bacterium]
MKPRFALFALLPIALFFLPAGVFWVDRSIAEGEVPRNVSIAGIDVSGLSYDDAMLTIQAYERQLQTTPAVFTVNEHPFRLDPSSVSVEADEVAAVEDAITQRTEGGPISRFWSWLGGFSKPVDVHLPITMDREAIDDQLAIWQDVAIPNPAYEGSVAVVDSVVVVEYPQAGEQLEMSTSAEIVVETLSVLPGREARLPVVDHQPKVTNSDVDSAAVQVRRMINSDVILTNSDIDYSQTFTADEVARAVYTEISTDPVEVSILLDEAVVRDLLEPHRSEFELPPVSAQFKAKISNSEVYYIPGRNGTTMNAPAVTEELLKAAQGSKTGPFPVSQGDEPRLTNEEAEAYGPMGLVSKFTTNTPGRNRVHNIHLMADTIDEHVVFPGQTFSINEVVGPRTEAKGYLEDCAIINGAVVCEGHPANIGGGVSQFSTTFYNAVFYGCYEDVEHKPHSLYFPKYPEVIEATMGYPSPDVKFRNNSDAPVIIRAAYTDSTVTVLFYGNNGGKTCTADWGERTNPEEWETVYVSAQDEELDLRPGQEKQVQSGINGFTQTVTRIIKQPDGTKERERTWTWRYVTQDKKIAVHACMVTGEPVNCPVPLPSVVGMEYVAAQDKLGANGYGVNTVWETTETESKHGVVLSMDPSSGTYLRPGATVTISVGVYEAPPTTTTPPDTTTTTAPTAEEPPPPAEEPPPPPPDGDG